MHVVWLDERLFLSHMGSSRVCKECGAESAIGAGRCLLCGAPIAEVPGDLRTLEIDRYQAEIRRLRRQLKETSEGDARAV